MKGIIIIDFLEKNATAKSSSNFQLRIPLAKFTLFIE